jgi:hypothetical protein
MAEQRSSDDWRAALRPPQVYVLEALIKHCLGPDWMDGMHALATSLLEQQARLSAPSTTKPVVFTQAGMPSCPKSTATITQWSSTHSCTMHAGLVLPTGWQLRLSTP